MWTTHHQRKKQTLRNRLEMWWWKLTAQPEAILSALTFHLKNFERTIVRRRILVTNGPSKEWLLTRHIQYLIFSGIAEDARMTTERRSKFSNTFETDLRKCLKGWRFAITDTGDMVMVPNTAMVDDKVCLLFGVDVSYVLRPELGLSNQCRLVGHSYSSAVIDDDVY